jgi:hypothetical protein
LPAPDLPSQKNRQPFGGDPTKERGFSWKEESLLPFVSLAFRLAEANAE